ncbi:MAG: 2-dehydropantoate 2-reductase [Candidatus Omnitrophica bacterium]|nr:2-dehydropantoate 2-reductase [Candidatus Omnitrophota bacterium]
MTIAVIGAGAIGCVVAGYLSQAGQPACSPRGEAEGRQGRDVLLVGRPDQVKAIKTNGLTINGARGSANIRVRTVPRLDQPYDLVIFTVKTQDLEKAFQDNSEYLGTGLVLTSQNGVQADHLLSGHFDRSRQMSGIVMFGATYVKPGEVTFNFEGDWIIGRPLTPLDATAHQVGEVLGKAFKVVMSPDIMGMKYLKLFVNFNNCIPALIGKSMQETFADLDLCRLSMMLLKEGLDIVRHAKIEMVSMPDFPKEKILGLAGMPLEQGAAIINKTLTGLSKEPLYGSILQSILRGKTSEIEFINGEVVHLAKHLHFNAPLNERVVNMVHEAERTGKFFSATDVKNAFSIKSMEAV